VLALVGACGDDGGDHAVERVSLKGRHIAPTCSGADAIAAVQIAIAEAERLAGRPLAEALTDPRTGQIHRIRLVTDNSKEPRSPASSPPGPSCCTSAPGGVHQARTGCGSAPSGR
jgi:hypothetical protein